MLHSKVSDPAKLGGIADAGGDVSKRGLARR